jgi:metal-responsive CopG/Arc/MetJ family transcriptional regulator
MDHQIMKGVRLPLTLIQRIERIAKIEGSTFSQFVRTAVIEKLNERKKQLTA